MILNWWQSKLHYTKYNLQKSYHFLSVRELIENTVAPKHQKISTADHTALVDLLVSKDEEFRKMLELADEQAKIEQKMDELRAKVEVHVSTNPSIHSENFFLLYTNTCCRIVKYKSCKNH